MYSYSHKNTGSWFGEYDTPSQALIGGRANLDPQDAPVVYVARLEQAHYSDLFIGAETLLAYMREDGTERMHDEDLAAFDMLSPDQVAELDQAIKDLIGEWETSLPEEQQFTGVWVHQVKGYRQGEEVRPGHFPL